MAPRRSINVVGIHTVGKIWDVCIGGVLDVPGVLMYDKMMYRWQKEDWLRQLLMNEPRGSSAMCCNLILPACSPEGDAGFLTMEREEYPPMSGANTIAVATVLLKTGMVPMKEPTTIVKLDAAAGLVTVSADCANGKVESAAFDNVPAFVFALDVEVDVPGLGKVKVDAASVGLAIGSAQGAELVAAGERIKRAAQERTDPIHPENPGIRGVTILESTEPIRSNDRRKTASNTVVVIPGRLNRSPCGTGTCARMAVLHARGQLDVGQAFHHHSVIKSDFIGHLRGTTKVGQYDAVLPTVRGSAWITSYKKVVLDHRSLS